MLYMIESCAVELTQSPLKVYQDGFAPPYARASFFSARTPRFVYYDDVLDVEKEWYSDNGRERITKLAFELRSGERLVIPQTLIGDAGVNSLQAAWLQASLGRRREAPPMTNPPWVRKTARHGIILGAAITAFAVLCILLLLAAAQDDVVLIVLLVVALCGVSSLGVADILSARKWEKEVARRFDEERRLTP